jgi:hypothetical protein
MTHPASFDIDPGTLIRACYIRSNIFDNMLWSSCLREVNRDCPMLCTKTVTMKLTPDSHHHEALMLDSLRNQAISIRADGVTEGETHSDMILVATSCRLFFLDHMAEIFDRLSSHREQIVSIMSNSPRNLV